MATEKDFNVPPYFDDFDANNRYHRILFRPSVAVQARELTQLQTTLQDQIETFGNHMFKDGTIVDGVSIAYYPSVSYISLNDFFSNADGSGAEIVPTDLDSSMLVTNSTDSDAAVRASIKLAYNGTSSDYPNTNRLYFDYVTTGTDPDGNDINTFLPGDTLYIYANTQSKFGNLSTDNLLYTIETLPSNSVFTSNGTSYCMSVSEGTIFQKGFFARVTPQVISVNPFSSNVTGYVVGFNTVEEIVDENIDPSLADNALGYPNENAPGAHRLKLIPSLVAKLKTETSTNKNFFAIVEFDGQNPTEQKDSAQYGTILDQFANRTYEESGNYLIRPFQIEALTNSANSQTFYYNTSPGIGYVRGYRIEKLAPTKIEALKASTTEVAQNQLITANYGSYVVCDEFLGVFDTEQLSEVTLYDAPQNAISEYEGTSSSPTGNIVGKANVRAVVFEEGVKGSPTAKYLVYLFNIRMNSGKSFRVDCKSLYLSGSLGKAKADVVLENGVAVLKESTKNITVFSSGLSAVKRLTNNTGIGDTNYTYNQTKSATITTDGIVTVTLDTAAPGASTERLNQTEGSVLTGNLLEEYNVYLSANAYTANLSGTIAISSGSTLVTGGTSLNTQLTSNSIIRIYANTTQTYLRRVVSINSSTQMTLDTPLPASNSSCNFQQYFVAGTPLPLEDVTINSNTSFTANSGLSLDSGIQTVYCSYPVNRNQATSIEKVIRKNRFVKINCSTNVANTVGPWVIGLPDVHKLRHVYVGTTYSEANPDRISWFKLDDGQRDDMYDHARLIIKPQYASKITSSTRILVELDHFTANTESSVGFFSVESYPIDDADSSNTSAIQTFELPKYKDLELRNLIDFRPFKANTADSATSEAAATENPLANLQTFSISTGGQYMILPDNNFTADFEYYLPRYDMVTLDKMGNFGVVSGTPSVNPIKPYVESDQMIIAETYVPPYPSATKREYDQYKSSSFIQINLFKNKRYTMKDIGGLEERIKRVEYYTVLNALEQQARDLTIPDANGLDRFKNGIFADPFNSHNIGNVSDIEYKISIDKDETVARPYIQRHDVDFAFNSANSSNVQVTGPIVTLPYTDELYITQRFATKTRIASESFWQWNGLVDLYPSYDFFRDEDQDPDVNITLDLASPWQNFENSPFGSLYGDWREVSRTVTPVTTTSTTTSPTSITTTTTTTTTSTSNQARTVTGINVDTFSENYEIGNYITDVSVNPYMRSRLVAFVARTMKPNTTLHAFFDDVNVDAHCAPGVLSGVTSVAEGQENRIVNQNGSFGAPLVSDSTGFVCGLFRIPERTFRTGDRIFQLVNVDDLEVGKSSIITSSKARYTADNLAVTTQTTTLTAIQPNIGIQQNTETRTQVNTSTSVQTVTLPVYTPVEESGGGDGGGGGDPVAQSFSIESLPAAISSVFISKVGVFFQQKDPSLGCTLYICEMVNGFPDANKIVAKAYLPSSAISVSDDSTAETIFTLEHPVCLLSNYDYTFVIQPDANSPEYVVWTAETGSFDVVTNEQVFVNPYIGMMFLSANSKTWTQYQKEDLKFKLYRCKFTSRSGRAVFKNETDEYITAEGFTRASSTNGIRVGDVVFTVNGSISVFTNENVVANTLKSSVYGRIQYVNEASGELWLDSSTATSGSFFSNTTNPVIAVYRTPDASNVQTINATSLVAYSNVSSVDNLKYHAVVPKFGVIEPSKTSLIYQFKGTSSANVADTRFQNVVNGREYEFKDYQRHAMSRSNEILSLNQNKSSEFAITLQSQSEYVSPVVSLKKKSMLFIENLINNDATNEHTRYGNALTKYVSKRIVLADGQEAEDLKVLITAYRPASTNIKVYAKFLNNQDPEQFDDKVWTELQYDNGGELVYSSPSSTDNYIEYEFSVPSTNSVAFAAFANNSTNPYNPLSGGITIESGSTVINAKQHSFNANTSVNNTNDTIVITDANTYFSVGDPVIYNVSSGNTAISGLVAGNKYYVSFANTTQIALSESRTGANVNIAASTTSETGHFFTGTFFNEFFDVGDRIRIDTSAESFAIRTITNISNNTSMVVDNGLEATNTGALFYVFSTGSGEGIVEYTNTSDSRFVGFKEVALKIVLLSSNPVRVPKLNDVRAICLQV